MLLDIGDQYERVEKRITRFEIADQKIEIFEYNIESTQNDVNTFGH